MKKLENFPKENHERKQLEEIAHLYFSSPAPKADAPPKRERRERSAKAFSPFPRALYVQCLTGEAGEGLFPWFLYNLAVVLRILNGPVLLVASPRLYESRFDFGFRPDRERLRVGHGLRNPSGSFGPMGLCLLDGRVLWKGVGQGGRVHPVDPMAGRQVAFRYILSDEQHAGGVFGWLPRIKVYVVSPDTTTPALLGPELEEEEAFDPEPGHAGIVVAGAGSKEEGDALYRYWRQRIEERGGPDLTVEHFGMFSEPGSPGVGVLEDPESAPARFCQKTAALLRDKRSELLPAS